MNFRKITLAFWALSAICSCNNTTSSNTVKDTVAANAPIVPVASTSIDVDTTYKINPTTNTDSVVLNTNAFFVATKPNDDEPGERIAVYNKATKQSFALMGDDNFVDLNGNFLLTEAGTAANHRSFSVYDLTSLKMVFSGEYETDLTLQNNIVGFKTSVTITNPALKPKCSSQQKIPVDNLGYIEQQYFNLTTKKLQKTGKYECWYFE
jgi:hypothetical protein